MEEALAGQGSVIEVRSAGLLPECDGIVLPGGESTTIGMHLKNTGIGKEIKTASRNGIPLLATCAGLVLISRTIDQNTKVRPIELMDIKVQRNAFGPQRESFETDLDVQGFGEPYHAVFIRAPAVDQWGDEVEVLARVGDMAVAVRERNLIGLAFHPELTNDLRFHKMFLKMIGDGKYVHG
jgi:5'-phosphate synthase pdxT subunit